MRGAFWLAMPPGRMTSVSSASGAASTADQSGGGRSGRPRPPQPGSARGSAGGAGVDRRSRRVGGAQRLERDLGVDVGAVGGQDRQHQLADRIEAGLPDRPAVGLGQAVEDEGDEARALRRRAGRAQARATCSGPGFRRRAGRPRRDPGGRRRPKASRPPWPSNRRSASGSSGRRRRLSAASAPTPTSRASRSPAEVTSGAAFAIASRSAIGRSRTGTATHPWAARTAAPSGVTPPPTARHGTPAAAARLATPRAVLPKAVCASILALAGDHQVRQRKARVEARLLHHQLDAGDQLERAQVRSQAHQPEAGPAGGAGAGSVARRARRRRPRAGRRSG